MKTAITAAANMPSTNEMINNALRGLQRDIQTLQHQLIMFPKDYVVVAKDRMHVVQRNGEMAKIAIYPQLPALFHSSTTARQIATGFDCYAGERKIELEPVQVKQFAPAAIKDLRQRLADLTSLLETL